jgi:hypothetical protein
LCICIRQFLFNLNMSKRHEALQYIYFFVGISSVGSNVVGITKLFHCSMLKLFQAHYCSVR